LALAGVESPAVARPSADIVDIPAGAMDMALRSYARQARVDVLFSAEAVASLRSRGLRGGRQPEVALRRLLRGSGLGLRKIGANTFVITAPAAGGRVSPPASWPQAAADPAALDALVVQARRRDERLIDVPASIASVSSQALPRLGGDGVMALRQAALGLTVASQTTKDTPTLVIRGQRRATAGESALSVITYLNEAPLPNGGSILPLFDIDDVQVLRGPQGVLFGRNTTGGAVLIRTLEPGDSGDYVRVAAGGYGLWELEAAADLGSRDDVWTARLAAYHLRRDGLVENLGVGQDLDDRRQDALRLSAAYRPAGRFSAVLIYDTLRADETGSANILSGVYPNPPDVTGGGAGRTIDAAPYYDCGQEGCDVDIALAQQKALGVRKTRTDLPPRSSRRNSGLTARLDWEGGQIRLRSVTAYRRTFLDTALDSDGSALPLYQASTRTSVKQLTQEVRLSGQAANAEWQAGMFYLSSAPIGVQRTERWFAVTPATPVALEFAYRRSKSLAGFVDVTTALTRHLEVDLGLRYTGDDARACIARIDAPAADVTQKVCTGGAHARSSAPTWTAALTYRSGEDLTAYVVTRRAYRAGGVNAPSFAATLSRYQAYAPEKLTDIEVGVKAARSMGAWRSQLDLAIYRGWSRDIQRAFFPPADFDGDGVVTNDPSNLIVNAGSAAISGVEVSWRGRLDDRLDISLSSALTHARFTGLNIPAILASLTPTDPSRLRFSYTPRFTLGARAEWAVPAPPDRGRWRLWSDVFHSSQVSYVERARDTNGQQKRYQLVNLGLTFRPPGREDLEFGAAIENLFDKVYASGGGIVTPANTTTSLIYGDPRLWRVDAKLRF
jgi:outer membrane receptor protein involved in Fe transport